MKDPHSSPEHFDMFMFSKDPFSAIKHLLTQTTPASIQFKFRALKIHYVTAKFSIICIIFSTLFIHFCRHLFAVRGIFLIFGVFEGKSVAVDTVEKKTRYCSNGDVYNKKQHAMHACGPLKTGF